MLGLVLNEEKSSQGNSFSPTFRFPFGIILSPTHVKQELRPKAVMPGEIFWGEILGCGSACAETDCTAGRLDKPFAGQALPPADFLWSASSVLTGKRERLPYNS